MGIAITSVDGQGLLPEEEEALFSHWRQLTTGLVVATFATALDVFAIIRLLAEGGDVTDTDVLPGSNTERAMSLRDGDGVVVRVELILEG